MRVPEGFDVYLDKQKLYEKETRVSVIRRLMNKK